MLKKSSFLADSRVVGISEDLHKELRFRFGVTIASDVLRVWLWDSALLRYPLMCDDVYKNADIRMLANHLMRHFDSDFEIRLKKR